MKLLEIKNNLVKLAYGENESPALGKFVVLASDSKSYVGQFVNLKSDNVNNFAIAKLLFTFTPDGVVDNYDGSVPSMNSELSFLASDELLDLLPVETAVKIGNLAQQDDMLNLDISVFERNFTVFVERDTDKNTFVSNCVRQLFRMKEKSVIIDNSNIFEDYPKIEFAKDFKLPLNSDMIDYIFDVELAEVDAATKAVIQDIFYAVQQYLKTLDFEFLPIDNFIDVVADQYKETQMPELALLKNKLLKYRDANVFANTKEEVTALSEKLEQKNCSIIDLKNINESLQNKVISFIHKSLESFEKYIYFFVPLTDENSDKKLLKNFINHNHVFTTMLVSNSYKYAKELKSHAENVLIFAPQTDQHDFAAYNTFLNKLNMGECIAYGKLTQGIPFIVDMTDLELDLTKDDVLGDKYQFVPVPENLEMMTTEDAELTQTLDNVEIQPQPIPFVEGTDMQDSEIPGIPQVENETPVGMEDFPLTPELPVLDEINTAVEIPKTVDEPPVAEQEPVSDSIIEPVSNILSDEEDSLIEDVFPPIEELPAVEESLETDDSEEQLTEDDLNFIENTFEDAVIEEPSEDVVIEEEPYVESPYVQEQTPVVPVYPAESEESSSSEEGGIDFAQGDSVSHPRYGRGVVEKIIKYGNKTLCSISFENVGRRLLDPSISEFVKL